MTSLFASGRFSKSRGLSASVSFLPSPFPSPSFTHSIHRPVILCSRTAQKRLLRRLRTTGSQHPWNNDTRTFPVLKTGQQTSVDSSRTGTGDVKLLRLDSIRSIRCESNLVKPNRFTGSRVYKYGGCEVIGIRVDSIDSLRIEPCKVESLYRKSIFPVFKCEGCEFIVIRVDSIDSLRIGPCKFDSSRRKSICMHVLGV